ncbi:phytoene desaturase family protein [Streptomyces sp. KMM 9044]|uniref:phytoene desaturase family protein n=1 Tax=Streptomyces sp. KMM 9044 TaxID=2744474 RepID=UPI002150D477|nr:phytoene desaturase family protein [Streptomyces sp. KMM 9044]WAX77368.1 phytoene desaturase family protein [Streptomyces sp. KMM 9044]
MPRVAVIGAGMGGLAAAARLARQGHHVTVYERAATCGGKLGTVRRDGFVFDTGPSLLTLPEVYRRLFADTGAPLERCVPLMPVEPACSYRFADGTQLVMPGDPRLVPGVLDDTLGGGAGAQWARLHEASGELWRLVGESVLRRPLGGPAGLLRRSARPRGLTAVAPWRSLRGTGRHYLRDPRLRMWLERYATYSGSDPRRAPAVLAVVSYVEQRYGTWYVPGGLRLLADALEQRCTELGVRFRYNCRIAAVDASARGVTGLRLADGGTAAADIVVSGIDARTLYGHLTADRRGRRPLAALARAQSSLAGFVLLLALRGRDPRTPHHRVLFPADYDAEFDAVFGMPGRPAIDPTVYISAPDDAALRPDDGHEAWFVLVNAPRHSLDGTRGTVDWTAPGLRESYAERVLDVMADRGIDVRPRLLWCETRTPFDLEQQTGSLGGAIYGSSSNGIRAAFLRPANRSPVPGLFLVGGSAHPGGGLPLVALSAEIVAADIGNA